MTKRLEIEILGNVTSSKNSRILGHGISLPPRTYSLFVKNADIHGWDGVKMDLTGKKWVLRGIVWRRRNIGDADNLVVALLDFLKKRGVISDDREIEAFDIMADVDKHRPGATLVLEEWTPPAAMVFAARKAREQFPVVPPNPTQPTRRKR